MREFVDKKIAGNPANYEKICEQRDDAFGEPAYHVP